MSRWQAAGIHLGISALIAAVVLVVLYLVWYPSPYFTAMGGDQFALLVVGVDVVIGPLITLIIYRANKEAARILFSMMEGKDLSIFRNNMCRMPTLPPRPAGARNRSRRCGASTRFAPRKSMCS